MEGRCQIGIIVATKATSQSQCIELKYNSQDH